MPKEPDTYVYTYSCERPKNAEQDNLCIERKAFEATEEQAKWAGRTFWIGVAGTMAVVFTLIATAWAAWAAHRSADAAVSQVEVARKTLTEGRRPYILVEATRSSVPLVLTGYGKAVSFSYTVTNHGAGVALVTSYRDVIIIKQNLPDENDWGGVAFEISDDIIKSYNSIEREVVESKNIIDAEVFRMLQNNTTRAFIMGQVVYEDIFYETYVTRFCFEGGHTEWPKPVGGMDLNARS